MDAFIRFTEYYLPDFVLDNDAIAEKFPDWSVGKITSKIGILRRHIAAKDEFVSDMAVKVCEKLFAKNNIERSSIDFILLCTQSPDYILPTTACIVQNRLNLSKNIGALDFNLGCSGYIYGLALGKGLISSGIAKNVLLVTSETYSKFLHNDDKSNISIFGDGSTATLISTSGDLLIDNFILGTDGSGAENLIVRDGGAKYPKREYREKFDEFGNVICSSNLFMDGKQIFTFTLNEVPNLIENTCSANNLSLGEIDLIIPHQANKYMLEHLRKKLNIADNQFYISLEESGNTVSNTIPIALTDCMPQIFNSDLRNVLLVGFGVGYSWGGVVIRKWNENA